MKGNKLKKTHHKIILPFLFFSLFSISCNYVLLKDLPFSLNEDFTLDFSPSRIDFINSLDKFNEYLSDTTVFKSELSDKFKKINSKYDSKYFEKKDLISIIELATPGSIKGHRLKSIKNIDNYWAVKLESLPRMENVTTDMGGYFCYYLSVNKNPDIIGAYLYF